MDGGRGGGAIGRSATSTYRHNATTGPEQEICRVLACVQYACAFDYCAAVLDLCSFCRAARVKVAVDQLAATDARVSVCVVIPGSFLIQDCSCLFTPLTSGHRPGASMK